MIDWRKRHLDKIEAEGRTVLSEGITTEQFMQGVRAKRWPPGSTYLWTIGVCSPPVGYKPPEQEE